MCRAQDEGIDLEIIEKITPYISVQNMNDLKNEGVLVHAFRRLCCRMSLAEGFSENTVTCLVYNIISLCDHPPGSVHHLLSFLRKTLQGRQVL